MTPEREPTCLLVQGLRQSENTPAREEAEGSTAEDSRKGQKNLMGRRHAMAAPKQGGARGG